MKHQSMMAQVYGIWKSKSATFSEDDKKQMTLKVPFAEYVDPSGNPGIG